ncbi:hypothetical protein BC833DRAFT_651067 [Globomyces pollinis-pini]|nr:hypothetical protein BC833DRAFT_651067 [Globomyces pollinis-pini]
MLQRSLPLDPFKPTTLICKRLMLLLGEYNPALPTSDLNHASGQLLEDTTSIGDALNALMTKIHIEGNANLRLLKRLHLMPEHLRQSIMILLSGYTLEKKENVLKILKKLLLDLDCLKKANIAAIDNEFSKSGPTIHVTLPMEKPKTKSEPIAVKAVTVMKRSLNPSKDSSKDNVSVSKSIEKLSSTSHFDPNISLPLSTVSKTSLIDQFNSSFTNDPTSFVDSFLHGDYKKSVIEEPQDIKQLKPSMINDKDKYSNGTTNEKSNYVKDAMTLKQLEDVSVGLNRSGSLKSSGPQLKSTSTTFDDNLGLFNTVGGQLSWKKIHSDVSNTTKRESPSPILTPHLTEDKNIFDHQKVLSRSNSDELCSKKSSLRSVSFSNSDSPITTTIQLFLLYKETTVKTSWDQTGGIYQLKGLFQRHFPIDEEDFQVYIKDNQYGHDYLLQDVLDVKSGSLLSFRTVEPRQALATIDDMKRLEDQLQHILGHLKISIPAEKDSSNKPFQTALLNLAKLKQSLNNMKDFLQSNSNDILVATETEILSIVSDITTRKYADKTLERLENSTYQLLEEFNDFRLILETTGIDLNRGKRPGKEFQSYMELHLKELNNNLTLLKPKVFHMKAIRKKEWETTLHRILNEQKLVSDTTATVDSLDEMYSDLENLVNNISPIIEHQENRKLTTYQPQLDVWDAEEVKLFGMNKLLSELETVQESFAIEQREGIVELVDSQCREKIRTLPRNPLQLELSTFLKTNGLKDCGGYEVIEKLRKQKDLEILHEIYNQEQQNLIGKE